MKESREVLLVKYRLNESHATWQPSIDNWYSIEAFRAQAGRLPEKGDDTRQVLMAFLDNKDLHARLLSERGPEFGSMFLSAKRALYRSLTS